MSRALLSLIILCWCGKGFLAQSHQQFREQAAAAAERGDFQKAIDLSAQALALAGKDKKCSEDQRFLLRVEQASYYLLDEQVGKGEALFKDLFSESSFRAPSALAQVHLHYGLCLVFLGRHSEAEGFLDKARELDKSSSSLSAEDQLSCLQAKAVCEQYRYDFIASEKTFLAAEELCRKKGWTHSSRWAELQSRFALLYVDLQFSDRALSCYEKAFSTYRRTHDTLNPNYPVFLLEYGAALAEAYQYEKAIDLSFKARNIDRQLYGENSFAYAADLNNLGFIYHRLNRLPETEQFYKQSLAIKKNLQYQRLDSYLNSVNNLMVFYANTGREQEAMELASEIEAALKGSALHDTLKRAVFANNLAIHYKDWGQFQQSHQYFKQALLYYQAVYGQDNPFEAQIYLDMGTVFMVEGNWEELNKCLQKAADIYGKTKMGEDLNTIGTLCNLAIVLKEMNQPEQGVKYANRALQLAENLKVQQQDILEQVYLTKAQLAADLKYVQESIDYFNRYLQLKYEQLEQNFSYMTENEKLFFLEEFEKEIRNYYAVILSHLKEYPELIKALLDFRLKTKSLLLNNLSKLRQAAQERKDPALEEKLALMRVKRESVAKLMNFNTEAYPEALQQAALLKEEADQLEKEISLALSTSLKTEEVFTWRHLQALLKPGEAAIEIFQSNLIYDNNQGKGTNYTFLVLRDTGDPQAFAIDRPANWEAQVLQSYRNSISQMKPDPSLYARLWQLVGDQIKDCKTLYVSPDGIFNQINVNTLFHAQTGKYVIEETEVHLLSSLRNLGRLKQNKGEKPASAVLVGNPRFDLDLSARRAEDQTLVASATRGAYGFVMSELPGTKSEIEAIRKTLDQSGVATTVYSEAEASEDKLKAIRQPGVLHIATHGFFLEDARDQDLLGYSKLEKEYYKNPMLRSGIFLSGSNRTYSISTENRATLERFEDGMLTAYEAMGLNLYQTQLVVLSACETGLGKVKNGEGVFGLQRAFKLAGAASTMMSLWAVDDNATQELMVNFYKHWMQGKDLFAAYRQAQLDLKQNYPSPVYWGAFVLYDR